MQNKFILKIEIDDSVQPIGLLIAQLPNKMNYFTGEKFDFITKEIFNKTDEYNEIINELKEINKLRNSKKKTDLQINNCKKLEKLTKNIPMIAQKDDSNIFYTDDCLFTVLLLLYNNE